MKKALKRLETEKEWKRIIQVSIKMSKESCRSLFSCNYCLISFYSVVPCIGMSFVHHACAFYLLAHQFCFIGDQVDVQQRTRKNHGKLLHSVKCFS